MRQKYIFHYFIEILYIQNDISRYNTSAADFYFPLSILSLSPTTCSLYYNNWMRPTGGIYLNNTIMRYNYGEFKGFSWWKKRDANSNWIRHFFISRFFNFLDVQLIITFFSIFNFFFFNDFISCSVKLCWLRAIRRQQLHN